MGSDIMPFNNGTIFDGLEISGEKELCEEYMGKFPVISITFHFGDTHSGRIHRGKHGFIFQVICSTKKLIDFTSRKYGWEFVFYYHAWNGDIIPLAGHRAAILFNLNLTNRREADLNC